MYVPKAHRSISSKIHELQTALPISTRTVGVHSIYSHIVPASAKGRFASVGFGRPCLDALLCFASLGLTWPRLRSFARFFLAWLFLALLIFAQRCLGMRP